MVFAAWMKSSMSMVAPGSGSEKNRGPQCRTNSFVLSCKLKLDNVLVNPVTAGTARWAQMLVIHNTIFILAH